MGESGHSPYTEEFRIINVAPSPSRRWSTTPTPSARAACSSHPMSTV